MKHPFFNVIIHKEDSFPTLCGICAGFENKSWRKDQMVNYLFEYLPEFALSHSEFSNLTGANAIAALRQVMANIYQSDKFKSRGEFGELLLHVIIREIYNTIPAISKIFYKDGPNETVKGFDAVHVIATEDSLELWLGEVKFYNNIGKAIYDVAKELEEHSKIEYLKNEFVAITNKIDNSWEHSDRLKALLNPNTSLDDIFTKTCIPVLLTYDSVALSSHKVKCEQYINEITTEFNNLHKRFCDKVETIPLTIHLFLLPLDTKEALMQTLDSKLRIWQAI